MAADVIVLGRAERKLRELNFRRANNQLRANQSSNGRAPVLLPVRAVPSSSLAPPTQKRGAKELAEAAGRLITGGEFALPPDGIDLHIQSHGKHTTVL